MIKNDPQATVKLSRAEAFSDGNGVFIKWQAEYETQNLGFFIYRVDGNEAQLVSPSMVGGAGINSSEATVYGSKYTYFDPSGKIGNSYFIESLNKNGQRQTFEKFSPKYIDDLVVVAGLSSESLRKNKEETSGSVEDNLLKMPKELQSQIDANSLPPDIITHRWVVSQPGVKIGVKQEGIYRVSRAELQNAGFNTSAPGNLWQLYLDGKEQSIIVGDNDSYIEFYGKGIDTPESATRVYYLIAGGQDGRRMQAQFLRPNGGNVVGTSYFQSFVRKERQVYISADILNGEAENYFSNVPIIGSSSPTPPIATLTFNLTGIDYNIRKANFEIAIQGVSAIPHQIAITLNGEPLDPISGNGISLMQGIYQIPTTILQEGTNTLQMQSFGGSGDISLTESFRVDFARKYEAMQNRLSFYTSNYKTSAVSGFTSANVRVFDLTFPDNPNVLSNLRIDNNNGNFSVVLPSHRGRAMFAAEDTAILTASSVTANNPSTLATPSHNAEMLIVSYKDWMTQANDWANYRRTQGLTVEVVDIEDIFDEFSFGSMSSAGMTEFFKFAKNNWQTPPNYVLLLGDMTYDPRNYENRAFQNFIPTRRVDTLYEETGSDDALCDFNNDGLAEIAVGRIPARNAATVTQLLSKTLTFESGLATAFSRGAIFASDLPNGYDFEGLSLRLADQLPPTMPKTFINRGQANAKSVLLAALNGGPYLVNYSGHGSAGIWDGNFFVIADANALANAPNYSLYFMLTCLNGYFLRPDFDSLGEAVIKSPNGGGAASWASTGKTTPDVQEVMATRFYNQLNVGNMNRIGDLIRDAKQGLVGGRDVRLSWALLGDPALKIKP